MDDPERKRGLWIELLLLFDWLGYGTEWLRGLLLKPVRAFGGRCKCFLRSSFFPKADQRNEKLLISREERNRYCLHSQQLSFYDTYSVVSGVPAFFLSSDDAKSSHEDTVSSSAAETSEGKTTVSKVARSSVKQQTAFSGKSSESVQACVFSKDGSHFAICYVSGKVTLWNTDHGTLLQEELLKASSVCSISFLGEENSVLLICTKDCTCWKWDIDVNSSHLTKIFDKDMVSSVGEQIFSQKSDFYEDGTKLVLSTIANSEDGPVLDVVLVTVTSNPFKLEPSHLTADNVESDFVISNAILSPDGNGLLVSLMDQAFENIYCLLWPNLSEHRGYYKRLNKGTIGSWSDDNKYVVTWTMTTRLNSNNKNENFAFIWNVKEMRERLKNFDYSFKHEEIVNPFGGNVFWCQVIQDMDKKDRLIMGIIGETARFLFIDMASKTHTHIIETGISAKDMILQNGDAWTQSYVVQRNVKGLSPMGVTKDRGLFGAVLGWPSEIIIWDVYLGIEILRISPNALQANRFKGGIDLMASPSCTKFAIVGSDGVMVFCPSATSINKKGAKNCLESQMVQIDNPHTSQDNLSRFKMSFSGDGNSLGVLCIGSSKMQVYNLLLGTSYTVKSAYIKEGTHIQDFCLSRNGHYVAIYTKTNVQVWNCANGKVASIIDMTSIKCKVEEVGINDDASELVTCLKDGSISWYKLPNDDIHAYDEARPSASSSQRPSYDNLSLIEQIKAWFKRPLEDTRQELISEQERDGPSLTRETSIDIHEGPMSSTYPSYPLVEEINEATFQVSPNFEEVIRISETNGVEVWDLKTKEKRRNRVSDVASIKRSSYGYSHNSSITQQAHDELTSKKSELLNGTSIDLTKRTTLLQSSRDNIVVAGNSSFKGLSQRRDKLTFDIEYNEGTQEGSHSIYVINLKDAEFRRRLSGKNLDPRKGLAISHDGRHVACLDGDDGSKVVVWNVYAGERLLPDYNFLSLILAQDMSRKEGVKRDIVPLIQEFGINFFNFRHPSGRSILEEAIYSFNNDLLKAILRYVLKQKVKISFLTRDASEDSSSTSKPCNVIETSIAGRSPKTLCVVLKYLLRRVTHEDEIAKILTNSLVSILQRYKAIFTRAIRDRRLLSPGQEIKVPESSVEGQKFRTSTYNSLALSQGEMQTSWDKEIKENDKECGVPLVTSVSSMFPYVDACNIGAHGILRKLLINRVHHSAFGSFVVKAVVDYKWKQYGKEFLTQELFHHAMVSVSFTIHCFVLIYEGSNEISPEHYVEEESSLKSITLLVCWILAVPCLFREICQCVLYIINHGLPGFVYWLRSGWNWIEVCSYINVVVVIPLGQWFLLKEGSHRSILSALVAVESLLIWSRMLFYARPFDRTGPLVVTIAAIVREIFYFLILALSVMFGFALAFCVLYRHVEPREGHETDAETSNHVYAIYNEAMADQEEANKTMHEAFGTFRRSFFTVFRYTFGDLEMDVLYNAPEPVTALILFVLYVIIIAIILLNMLIALMSEKFARIHKNRKTQLIEARARAIDDIDSMLSFHRRKKLGENIKKYLHVLIESHRHPRITKGSSLQQTQSKAKDDMTKTVQRGIRRELSKPQRRSGFLPSQTTESRIIKQGSIAPIDTPLSTVEESVGFVTEANRGLSPPPDITEPDPYWSDTNSTDSEYSDRYSDDSD